MVLQGKDGTYDQIAIGVPRGEVLDYRQFASSKTRQFVLLDSSSPFEDALRELVANTVANDSPVKDANALNGVLKVSQNESISLWFPPAASQLLPGWGRPPMVSALERDGILRHLAYNVDGVYRAGVADRSVYLLSEETPTIEPYQLMRSSLHFVPFKQHLVMKAYSALNSLSASERAQYERMMLVRTLGQVFADYFAAIHVDTLLAHFEEDPFVRDVIVPSYRVRGIELEGAVLVNVAVSWYLVLLDQVIHKPQDSDQPFVIDDFRQLLFAVETKHDLPVLLSEGESSAVIRPSTLTLFAELGILPKEISEEGLTPIQDSPRAHAWEQDQLQQDVWSRLRKHVLIPDETSFGTDLVGQEQRFIALFDRNITEIKQAIDRRERVIADIRTRNVPVPEGVVPFFEADIQYYREVMEALTQYKQILEWKHETSSKEPLRQLEVRAMDLYVELRQLYVHNIGTTIALRHEEDGRLDSNRTKDQQALVKFQGILAQMQTIMDDIRNSTSPGTEEQDSNTQSPDELPGKDGEQKTTTSRTESKYSGEQLLAKQQVRDKVVEIVIANVRSEPTPGDINILEYPSKYGRVAIYFLMRDLEAKAAQLGLSSKAFPMAPHSIISVVHQQYKLMGVEQDPYHWQHMPVARYFAGLERLSVAYDEGTLNDYVGVRGLAKLAQEIGESSIARMHDAFGGTRSELEIAIAGLRGQQQPVRLSLPDDGLQWAYTTKHDVKGLDDTLFQEQAAERSLAELEAILDATPHSGVLQMYFPQEDTFGVHFVSPRAAMLKTLTRGRPFEIVSGVSKGTLLHLVKAASGVRPVAQNRPYILKTLQEDIVRLYDEDGAVSNTRKLTLEALGVDTSASLEEKLEALGIDPETLRWYGANPIDLATVRGWAQTALTSLEIRTIDTLGVTIVSQGDPQKIDSRLEQVDYQIVGRIVPVPATHPSYTITGNRLAARMPKGQKQVEMMSVDGRSGFWDRSKRIFTGAAHDVYVAGWSEGRISYTKALDIYDDKATERLQRKQSYVVVYVPSLKRSLVVLWNAPVRAYLRTTHHHVLLFITGQKVEADRIVEQLQGQSMHYWAKSGTRTIAALRKVEGGEVRHLDGDIHLQDLYAAEGTNAIPPGVVVSNIGLDPQQEPPALQGVDSLDHQDQIRQWAKDEFGSDQTEDVQFTMLGTMVEEVWIRTRTAQGYVGVAYQGRPDNNWESTKRSDMLEELTRLQSATGPVNMRSGQITPMPPERKRAPLEPVATVPAVELPEMPGKLSLPQLQQKLEASTASSILLVYFPQQNKYETYELAKGERVQPANIEQTYVVVAGVSRYSLNQISGSVLRSWLRRQGNPFVLKSLDTGLVRVYDGDGSRSTTQKITRETLGLSATASADEVLEAIGIDPANLPWYGTQDISLKEVSRWPQSKTESLEVVDLVGLGVKFVYETDSSRGSTRLAMEQVDHFIVGKVVPYGLEDRRFKKSGTNLANQLPKDQSVVEVRSAAEDRSGFWNAAGERVFTGAAQDGAVAHASPSMPEDAIIHRAYEKAIESLQIKVPYVVIHVASRNEFLLVKWLARTQRYVEETSDQVVLVVATAQKSLTTVFKGLPNQSTYFWMNASTGAVSQVERATNGAAQRLPKTLEAIAENRAQFLQEIVSNAKVSETDIIVDDARNGESLGTEEQDSNTQNPEELPGSENPTASRDQIIQRLPFLKETIGDVTEEEWKRYQEDSQQWLASARQSDTLEEELNGYDYEYEIVELKDGRRTLTRYLTPVIDVSPEFFSLEGDTQQDMHTQAGTIVLRSQSWSQQELDIRGFVSVTAWRRGIGTIDVRLHAAAPVETILSYIARKRDLEWLFRRAPAYQGDLQRNEVIVKALTKGQVASPEADLIRQLVGEIAQLNDVLEGRKPSIVIVPATDLVELEQQFRTEIARLSQVVALFEEASVGEQRVIQDIARVIQDIASENFAVVSKVAYTMRRYAKLRQKIGTEVFERNIIGVTEAIVVEEGMVTKLREELARLQKNEASAAVVAVVEHEIEIVTRVLKVERLVKEVLVKLNRLGSKPESLRELERHLVPLYNEFQDIQLDEIKKIMKRVESGNFHSNSEGEQQGAERKKTI